MQRTGTPTAVFGDWNLPADKVAAIAQQAECSLVRGRNPDHAIIGGPVVVRRVRVLEKYGSDAHEAILYFLDVEGTPARVLLWNVWVGNSPTRVRDTIRQLTKEHDLDVVVLNEAYRCGDQLQQLRDWTVHQGPNIGEGADVALLVRAPHEIRNSGVMRMRRSWTVLSHDRVRAGREYPFVRIRLGGDDGPVLRILGIHLPTDHPINADAVDESITRITEWAKPRH